MKHIYRRTLIALQQVCSPVNLLHIFRTSFHKNTSGWLLLILHKTILCDNKNPPWFNKNTVFNSRRYVILETFRKNRNNVEMITCLNNLNPFYASDLFWYPLKTSENLLFSDVFRGYQKRSVSWNGLMTVWLYRCKAKLLFWNCGNVAKYSEKL